MEGLYASCAQMVMVQAFVRTEARESTSGSASPGCENLTTKGVTSSRMQSTSSFAFQGA